MGRTRFLILVLGPIVIVAASTAGALVTRSDTMPSPMPVNQFLVPAEYPAAKPFPIDAKLVAACRERAQQLQLQLEPDDVLLVEPPFVIVGKMSKADLEDWYHGVILPASAAMRVSYFDRAPDEPVTLILCADEQSYLRYAGGFASEQALAYFGYYDAQQRTVVANVRTGAGTLVHELTHALMDFDFPRAPAWFAEGLAALHEHCRLRDDGSGLEGLENWRFAELRTAQEAGLFASLKSLTDSADFHGADQAKHYAHARAFVLYLQRQGLLRSFYQDFRDRFEQDSTGGLFLNERFAPSADDALDASFRLWFSSLVF